MRKVSLKFQFFAFFCVLAAFLSACMMSPDNLSEFLDDDRVEDLFKRKGGGVNVGVDFENPEDRMPELQWSDDGGTVWTALVREETVTVSLGDSTPVELAIKVVNEADYDTGSIIWTCEEAAIETGSALTVEAGVAPFIEVKTYHLAVEGKKEGTPYSTYIFIEVVD